MEYITTNTSWRAISSSSNLAFQVVGAFNVEVGRSAHNVAPVAGFIYNAGTGDRGEVSSIFPTSTGNTVWARSSANSAVVLG